MSDCNPNALTLAQCIQMRDAWFAAVMALSQGQEYTIQDGNMLRKLQRSNLKDAQNSLQYWESRVRAATPGARRRVRFGVPIG